MKSNHNYVPITTTKCGTCKHLKRNLPNYPNTYRRTNEPYLCEAHGETLPETVIHYFAEGCADYEKNTNMDH